MQRKVIRIGDGLGIILPKKLLSHLKASVGDTLVATQTADGIDLATADPDLDHQLATARHVMARRKHALRKMS